jgi:hypothetical protein
MTPMGTSDSTGNSRRPASAGGRWTAWLTVAATIIIAALSATAIGYRYLITPMTDCVIYIDGDKSMDGDTVEVIPKVAADPDRSTLRVMLQEKNDYSARFYLSSGTYQVIIKRPDGSNLIDMTDFIPPGRSWRYGVPGRRTATGRPAATQPAPTR